MPDNFNGGELEDFIEKMMPENEPVWPMSGSYVDNISEENRKFTLGQRRVLNLGRCEKSSELTI